MTDFDSNNKPKLLEQVKTTTRAAHYSKKTEESYTSWIKRFVLFHNKKHPKEMGAEEIKAFINNLAVNHHVSSATQNQALQGILFLYKNVLNKNVGWIEEIKFAHRKKHLPVVLTKDEVNNIFKNLNGITLLISKLLYGSGLRLGECLSLRVKDVDLEMRTISVLDGKGEKDRVTVLPEKIISELTAHITKVRNLHKKDSVQKSIEAPLPYALAKKYPNAGKEIAWQYLFRQKVRFIMQDKKSISEFIYIRVHFKKSLRLR